MKKKVLLIVGIVVIIAIIIALIVFEIINKAEKERNNDDPPISTLTQIELNSKQYINQLEKIKIKGTDDTFMITEKVKWEVPDHREGVTVSFAIAIPYTITVNGKDYHGTYVLDSSMHNRKKGDNNPKYDIEITNLKKNYETEIIITKK